MTYLKESIFLCEEKNNANKKTFKIVRRVPKGRGSSAVCYEAYHESSGRGILKEFYPLDESGLSLKRDSEGQLIFTQEAEFSQDLFRKAEKDYLEPYYMLLAAKQQGKYPDLDTFIPPFEIYRGCSKDGTPVGTVYIWSPQPKLETFDKICDEIHKNPTENPQHKLAVVLTSIEALVRCVSSLHQAEIIHRDIKPSNFGFLKRANEPLPQTISLFDINSMCSIFDKNIDEQGTDEFWEPEKGTTRSNVQTDIYSIGATLFNAIIITDEVKKNKYHFKQEYYDNLQELVNTSKLIQASEANSHPHLRSFLTKILQKTLCKREQRYQNCEELLEDVQMALTYVLPPELCKKMATGQRWLLADTESKFDKNSNKRASLSMSYHLYQHPLYACAEKNSSDLNVLVFGFGGYGQKFLDACLQAGQMHSRTLNVTIVSDAKIDKEVYLKDRPALSDFFNIDSEGTQGDSYGNINFVIKYLNRINYTDISNVMKNIMTEHYSGKKPDYVFIALGDDKLNISTTRACSKAIKSLGANCFISYACDDSKMNTIQDENIAPVFVNEDVTKLPLHADLERMAFNTHLIWEKNLNVDFKNIKKSFQKPYNHDSSISSALSIKYKLYDIGIDLSKLSYTQAAEFFTEKMKQENDKDCTVKANNDNDNLTSEETKDKPSYTLRDLLIWIEHRRWVTEKLCLGWQAIDNLEECATGKTKDERRKRHVCIVRSRPEQTLTTDFWTNYHFQKWNKCSQAELAKLDDLDRMSVLLHRMYVKKASEPMKENLLSDVESIKALIETNRKSLVAFQEWFSCIKEIRNKDLGKLPLYEGLKNAFLDTINNMPKNIIKNITDKVSAFDSMFYPILASVKRRNWKQDDAAIVDNIPFVLTYTEDICMVIPYDSNRKNAFNNVASATVVNPAKILYVYLAEESSHIEALKAEIPYTVSYMKKKLIRASVDFIIAYTESAKVSSPDQLSKEIKEAGNGKVRNVNLLALTDICDFPELLEEHLTQQKDKFSAFAVEKNNSSTSKILRITPIYKKFANYEFISADREFITLKDCDFFRYIKKSSFITVSDMISLGMSSSTSIGQPQFHKDYTTLWEKYIENVNTWKAVCKALKEHSDKNDLLVSFDKYENKPKSTEKDKGENTVSEDKAPDTPVTYNYFIPFHCRKGANKVIDVLLENKVVMKGSGVTEHNMETCKVSIIDKRNNKALFDKLFSNIYALMFHEAINPYLDPNSHKIHVVFDNLMVSNFTLPNNKKKERVDLLEFFAKKGYIINLVTNSDGTMNFTYSTRQFKDLLTQEGKMLEIYVYHKAKASGKFDDVVSGFEIDWMGTEVTNEIDCILTKGFRTLFVEVKARSDIEQDFYFKIEKLSEIFGINPTAVLIADSQGYKNYDLMASNETQKARGDMMEVVTISNHNEILDIGETLYKIIKDKNAT